MSDWKPIETAPKDGQEVLGFYLHEDNPRFNCGPWTMMWRKKEWVPSWDGSRVMDYMSDFGTDYKDLDMNPTNWQALPMPPVT